MEKHTDGACDDAPEGNYEPVPAPEPPRPINWNLLSSQDLEQELLELNRWVNWLRQECGLSSSVIPPL